MIFSILLRTLIPVFVLYFRPRSHSGTACRTPLLTTGSVRGTGSRDEFALLTLSTSSGISREQARWSELAMREPKWPGFIFLSLSQVRAVFVRRFRWTLRVTM